MKAVRTFIYKKTHRSGRVTWVVRWKHPETGQWLNRSAGRTRDEAEETEDRLRERLRRGEIPGGNGEMTDGPLHVTELIDLYYLSPRFLNFNERGRNGARAQFEMIRSELGKEYFSTLTKERILRFYLSLKQKKGLSHATLRKYHFKLTILGQLHLELKPGLSNPLQTIKRFSQYFPKQAPTRDINFLTNDELGQIFEELKKCRAKTILPFIQFLAFSGLRRSEALELEWKDIDFSGGFIYIRRSKNAKPRQVPLESMSIAALKMVPRVHDRVFVNAQGQPYHPDSLLKPLKRAVKRTGIEKRVDIHTLRHSFGSNKIRQGWGLKKVSMILGHSDISITSTIYTHLLDGDLKVRDEFWNSSDAFDKNVNPENSIKTEDGAANLVATLNQWMKQLDQIPSEVFKRPDFAQIVQGAVQALFIESCNELQPSAAKAPPIATPSENTQNVPHMFRKEILESAKSGAENKNGQKSETISSQLAILKNGGPGRIRTSDLRIRSATL